MPASLTSLATNRIRVALTQSLEDQSADPISDATLVAALCDRQPIATVIDATNATPIVIETAVAHGLNTGDKIFIYEILGNHAANGQFTVTVVDATHFSLDGTAGSGAYIAKGAREVYKCLDGLEAIALTYITGSDNQYSALLDSDIPIAAGSSYRLFVWDTGLYADKFVEYQDFRAN